MAAEGQLLSAGSAQISTLETTPAPNIFANLCGNADFDEFMGAKLRIEASATRGI